MEMQDDNTDNIEDSDDQQYIIKLESHEAYVYKHLLECFHAGLTIIVLTITNKGLYCRNDNSKTADSTSGQKLDATLLIDMNLPRKAFTCFKIPKAIEEDDNAVLHLPLEASILRQATTCILKHDNISFIVLEDNPMKLDVRVFNIAKERDIETTVQLLDISDLAECFLKPVQPVEYNLHKPNAVGKSAEFMKACSGSGKVKSAIVNVIGQSNGIMLTVTKGEVSKKVKYGVFIVDKDEVYNRNFIFQGGLQAVVKACPMSSVVRIYCQGTKPLLVSLDIGTYGVLNIYLVPK